eukprot:8493300-Alexandrium_andersonii.AAC.1
MRLGGAGMARGTPAGLLFSGRSPGRVPAAARPAAFSPPCQPPRADFSPGDGPPNAPSEKSIAAIPTRRT